jgi:hypothetical protein
MLLYEPRAIWSVQRLVSNVTSGQTVPRRLRFPDHELINGQPNPITITHMLVSPIGYTFDVYSDNAALDASNFRNCRAACFDFAELQVGVKGRHYWNQGQFAPLRAWGAVPAGGPAPLAIPAGVDNAFYSPATLHTYRWAFPKPLWLAPSQTIDFALSGYPYPPFNNQGPPASAVKAEVAFDELQGAPWPGGSRRARFDLGATLNPPFGADGFGVPTQSNTDQTMPSTSTFNGRDFLSQQRYDASAASVVGFSVALDQRPYDDALRADSGASPAGASGRIASLGSSLAVTAGVANGTRWWRPKAPLSLVCPTMTNAQVWPLPEPFVLAPYDTFSVELEVPDSVVVSGQARPTVYQVGVSFVGYVEISG